MTVVRWPLSKLYSEYYQHFFCWPNQWHYTEPQWIKRCAQLQLYLLFSKGSKTDPAVRTEHWEQRCGSLRTKIWQDSGVATQEVRAECCSIYDEHDRCELGLSNCWQSWRQNRQGKKTGVSCNHLSAIPPPAPPPSTVSHWQRGHWLQGVFVMGCWQGCYSSSADGKRLCIGVHLWGVRYIYSLIFTHRICWRWMEWLQACWWKRDF